MMVAKYGGLKGFLRDVRSLFKGPVLVVNVLPIFTGFWLALFFNGYSFADHLDVFLLAMVGGTLLMGGALVINNWYDVDIDTIMERTKKRPTVTGHFSLKSVLITGIALSVIGQVLLLFTTYEAAIYGFIGWFSYVVLYTMWSKRRYTLNTVIGSVSGAVSPMIGWTAIDSGFQLVPIILFLILFIWQMPHTFAIAIRKYEEYKAAKVAMLPVVYGLPATKRQIFVYVLCLLPLPLYLVSLGGLFVLVAMLANLGFLAVAILGFYAKDDMKWARVLFLYSVNYITIIFLLPIAVTLPAFW
ncbi:heme o synthase [Neobacillus sp. YIM B06451]|uniref:heme o synthase n=1 Tax=Neobacillus sp. YIM B06451 TaxID=3070994 RepID=UPI0029305AC5|nr:heme o synthase [Neobacillus sp. YIM B06451]